MSLWLLKSRLNRDKTPLTRPPYVTERVCFEALTHSSGIAERSTFHWVLLPVHSALLMPDPLDLCPPNVVGVHGLGRSVTAVAFKATSKRVVNQYCTCSMSSALHSPAQRTIAGAVSVE